jgi:arginyl-tRNA synthetase
MTTLIKQLAEAFRSAALAAFPELDPNIPIEITQSTQDKFGHYQCNSAMKLGKLVQGHPRQIAEKLLAHLNKSEPKISQIDIAGPGFINITIDPAFIGQKVDALLRDPRLGVDVPTKKQRIIAEFSSPNVAKEMHVGHLRSTIIGDSIARLFEFLGHDVLRLNHIGDWGTAFGMLIAYMKEKAPHVLTGEKATDLTQLCAWYKAAKYKFDTNPEFKLTSQREVVALQGGDPTALQAWNIICEISRKAYQEIYDLLDINLNERGESTYNPWLAEVVAELDSKGLVTVSEGAKCIFLEGFQNREGDPLPLMIQKSDGGYNYDTTDMAAIRQRIVEEKADRIIVVTDAGQSTHFQMVIKAAEKAGYLDPAKVRVDHVTFGLVLGGDGKKFRTRSGDTEKLIDLLVAAEKEAENILIDRNPEMDPTERKLLADTIGINAVKYADLSCNRVHDYVFSYERMLKFEGNTAAFLMYAYVRVGGIKRRLQADIDAVKREFHITLTHPSEVALALHLLQFAEALELVAQELLPNRLTDYLYILAEKFNAFFRDCRVEGTAEQNSRLLLCEAVALVMKQGMTILGLKTVDKM